MRSQLWLLTALILILPESLMAFGPTDLSEADSVPAVMAAILDANEVGMYFSNNGSLARDELNETGSYPGLIFPADSAIPLIYSAGLWLSASVDGSPRIALSEYGSEFLPGPMGHEQVEDSSIFRVYKISAGDNVTQPDDWVEWPSSWGAPVDSEGEPLLTGEQSLWAVFNDSLPSGHYLRGGSTDPLGAEVRMYACEYRTESLLDNIVIVEYEILNKSGQQWDNFVAGVWADPDLGTSADDLGGTDSLLSLVYCYTLENDAELPVGFCPAVGTAIINSPSSENGMHASASANIIRNLTRSGSPEMTLDLIDGLTYNGQPYVDPETGKSTKYPYGGDPRTNTGWIDFGKGDRKTLICSAPVSVAAGETVHMTAAFMATFGSDNFTALGRLFELAEAASDFGRLKQSGLSAQLNVPDGSTHSVSFTPAEQLWFKGVDWGGDAFDGGIGWAGDHWGTNLRRIDNTDIELQFTRDSAQWVARFTEKHDAYEFKDFIQLPFFCSRSADSAVLNMILVDVNNDGNWWAPNDSAATDYILITNSQYRVKPVGAYAGKALPNDAPSMDLMYTLAFSKRPGALTEEVRNGQLMKIRVTPDAVPVAADTVRFGDVTAGFSKSVPVTLENLYSFPKHFTLLLNSADAFDIPATVIQLGGMNRVNLSISFFPDDVGDYVGSIRIEAEDYGLPVRQIVLSGRGEPWPLEGDLFSDGVLDLKDATLFAKYLYGSWDLDNALVITDLNNSGDTDLTDLVIFLQRLFAPF